MQCPVGSAHTAARARAPLSPSTVKTVTCDWVFSSRLKSRTRHQPPLSCSAETVVDATHIAGVAGPPRVLKVRRRPDARGAKAVLILDH